MGCDIFLRGALNQIKVFSNVMCAAAAAPSSRAGLHAC
jgi:hypothetical protein